ncbi:hypothetical protein AC4HA11_1930 [Escherichia phage vB_EcoA_4HA11]|nr:hypothetical protein AC4HA11_1930 [Escherichia phage vB_EcoA_4HA11]
MSSIEQLITPQYVYSNIVEHLRSQLNVGTLNSTDLKDLQIVKVEVAAFGSRYHFNVEYTREEKQESSMLLLSHPPKIAPPKVEMVKRTIIGYLEEKLEPGAQRPTFDFQARFATED